MSLKQIWGKVSGFENLTEGDLIQKALLGEAGMVADSAVQKPHAAPDRLEGIVGDALFLFGVSKGPPQK